MKFGTLSNKEIDDDIKRYKELIASNELVEKQVPEEWVVSKNSPKRYKVNLLLSIFGFLFALDRWYLKKWISAPTKMLFVLVGIPLSLWGIIDGKIAEFDPVTAYVFLPIIILAGVTFIIVDIILAIINPRDAKFRGLKHG
ncbi:NINE protein [Mycoplasma sp. E35C]|uniref:NINE protein n=1 Tax=Mycoplasma sp. E35C TaxID=2801918 RepID=UPI001CA394FF|nr:NINE protein [Mycoplasma sp. E35C]QZX49101.1 TM2 domain-containing protein [Mycoplasma sp. E35C]